MMNLTAETEEHRMVSSPFSFISKCTSHKLSKQATNCCICNLRQTWAWVLRVLGEVLLLFALNSHWFRWAPQSCPVISASPILQVSPRTRLHVQISKGYWYAWFLKKQTRGHSLSSVTSGEVSPLVVCEIQSQSKTV